MKTIFENEVVKVEMNTSDEVFVTIPNGVQIRVSPEQNNIKVTAVQNTIQLYHILGLPTVFISK